VLRHYSQELLDLLLDVDTLLATDEHFLLGVWLENAKNMSTSDRERRLYEYNARNQITLWGPDGNVCAVAVMLTLKFFVWKIWKYYHIGPAVNEMSGN